MRRSLEIGLPAADTIEDRTISTFSRTELPHFAGINTFMHFPYLEDVREVGNYDVAIVGAPSDMGTTYRAGASPGNLAVGYGVVASGLALGVEETLHAYFYATVASLVAAGQKLVPLAGSAAQRVLYELGEDVTYTAQISQDMEVDDMHAFSPTVDVRSMMHERQRTRLYIS
jgi:hypothetical protein